MQRIVTIAESDLTETAGAGYPDVKSDDPKAADEALGQFISDTVACLDVQGDSATEGATTLRAYRADRCCAATQSAGK